MGIMNGLTFGGINSLDYGIYISGDAVFNAPDRSVEMLEIPGRNGEYVLDHGRFENIEVSYPAGTFGDDQTDFREKLSDFRNAILSQQGYQRLTDTYHPDEYRMGVYASGLEVSPVHYNTAGEFVLTFNCKPQRWLTSGETATSIADGGTITNPTLFEASPLLEVVGYGNVDIGGQDIDIQNVLIGDIVIYGGNDFYLTPKTITLDTTMLNSGDDITIPVDFSLLYSYAIAVNSLTDCTAYLDPSPFPSYFWYLHIVPTDKALKYGTAKTITCYANYTANSNTITATCTITYDGNDSVTVDISVSTMTPPLLLPQAKISEVTAYSTKSALGNPMYIDLNIGEAWNEDYGEPVSVNNAVNLGSDLPTLPPGATTVNYDNTITDLKITPRWWKV